MIPDDSNNKSNNDDTPYDPYLKFTIKQKITNLKPNTIYYMLFVQRNSSKNYSSDMTNKNQYSGLHKGDGD